MLRGRRCVTKITLKLQGICKIEIGMNSKTEGPHNSEAAAACIIQHIIVSKHTIKMKLIKFQGCLLNACFDQSGLFWHDWWPLSLIKILYAPNTRLRSLKYWVFRDKLKPSSWQLLPDIFNPMLCGEFNSQFIICLLLNTMGLFITKALHPGILNKNHKIAGLPYP